MYLLAITFGLCISYFVLLFLFPFFFENRIAKVTKKSFLFVALLSFLSLILYIVVFHISDEELGNRFQHAFGGGFLAFFLCYLVVKDVKLSISKFRFFIFSALIVTAMGVANEIIEYLLQNYAGFTLMFSNNINDTWLDLISNTVGILVATACFTPFVNREHLGKKSKSTTRKNDL